MASFTLHLPRDARPGDPGALERAEVVKDAFSWGAFFFTALWFFYHRCWIAGLLVLIAVVTLNGLMSVLDIYPLAAFVAQVLLCWLIGLEANSLRRWTLTRRGLPAFDVVSAPDQDEAEAKSYARWLARTAPLPRPAGPAVRPRPTGEPVLGLFPDPERFR
ncbi:DUF2628 domain-containing protein [Microvirga brassicacearum]|uniref:DUF2628 domain-containing protein n=2 Tax=Microvirga brassicacearum TaxID=2580413 RepID=A0A5N3PE33_9HYPH|nr:DUF2628 domain-containing protein [Microvirga brassicacearum]